MKLEYLLIIFALFMNVLFFMIGYLWCNFKHRDSGFVNHMDITTKRKNKHKSDPVKLVDIDETKVVVAIKTDNMEKKYENLGDVKKSEENITGSINKLKNLKG